MQANPDIKPGANRRSLKARATRRATGRQLPLARAKPAIQADASRRIRTAAVRRSGPHSLQANGVRASRKRAGNESRAVLSASGGTMAA